MHPVELILGYPYLKSKAWLKKSEYFSRERHLNYQRKKLANLLIFAAQNIPFYRERVGHLIKEISDENAFEILKQFPFISKPIIRKNLEQLCINSTLRRLKATTGGTSASPMHFYMDRFVTRQTEKAYIWNLWSRKGYKPRSRIASFTGRVPKNGKPYHHNVYFNIYAFSSFDLIEEKISTIVSALNNIKPEFLHGYPSTLTYLAKLIQKSGFVLSFKIKAVFCGSEKTHSHQRELIENVFDTKVLSWYGHSEYCLLGGECEHSQSYHLYPQYGYAEFLEIHNASHSTGKKVYEIIGTGFNNWIMPFIRYKTADYAVLENSTCECGRNYTLIQEVVGRAQEFVLDRDENLISVTALTSLYEKLPFIHEAQIIQELPGKLIFLIEPSYEPSKNELEGLILKIETTVKSRLSIEVQLTQNLQKPTGIKKRIVDQRIDLSSYLA